MVAKILVTEFDGTPPQITFADFGGDFSPTASQDLRHATAVDTECQLAMASVANGAARQSNKVDLGADRAAAYNVRCAFEFAATPTAGNVVELYWAPSQHATAATANGANVSGSDSAYSGYSSNLAASVRQLQFIGVFVCTAQATTTVQIGLVGVFSPPERYGTLVVKNESAAGFHTNDIKCMVVFDPIVDESQ